jgi:DNA invertase Pin-like site-specific DNA recombinase
MIAKRVADVATIKPASLILLSGRGSDLVRQRVRLHAVAGQLGLEVFGELVFRRRHRSELLQQVRAALSERAGVVVLDRLAALANDPLAALLTASEIRTMGLALVSASEPWLSEAGPTLLALGEWLAAARLRQRSEVARAALARARADGRRLGRPRKAIDLAVAVPLAGRVGIERCAALLSVGASTLRRAIAGVRPSPPNVSVSAPPELRSNQ